MTSLQPNRRYGSTSGESTEKVREAAEAGPVLHLPVAAPLVTRPTGELTQEDPAIDGQLIRRIENLPKEAGWILIAAGVIGVIAPGVAGVPFLVAGAFVVTPGGPRFLSRWAGRKPRKFAHSVLRQMCRLLDDLERRYPSARAESPPVVVLNRKP